MPITWQEATREFHLHNGKLSLVLGILDNGWLGQLHFGAPLDPNASYRHLGPAAFHGFGNRVDEPIALIVPTSGGGDFRIPALVVDSPGGGTVLDLVYAGHRISPG